MHVVRGAQGPQAAPRADGRRHRAQAGGAGAAQERAQVLRGVPARAGGGPAAPRARRHEEHVPGGGLARPPDAPHVDPRFGPDAGADPVRTAQGRIARPGPAAWPPTPGSSNDCCPTCSTSIGSSAASSRRSDAPPSWRRWWPAPSTNSRIPRGHEIDVESRRSPCRRRRQGRADHREPAVERDPAHAARHQDLAQGFEPGRRPDAGGRRRGPRRSRRTCGRRSSSRSARRPAHRRNTRRAWAWDCRWFAGSPNCTGAAPGSRPGRAAARRSRCSCLAASIGRCPRTLDSSSSPSTLIDRDGCARVHRDRSVSRR